MVSFDDALDSFADFGRFFLDVIESCGDAIAKPPTWSRRRAEDEPTYIGEGVWSSVQLERQVGAPIVKRYDWTYEALRVYRPYKVLEAERRKTKCDDRERQTLSFLDLPGEIRTQIYKLALVFESIETETQFRSRSHTIACAGRDYQDAFEVSRHYKTWVKTVRPALGLLRVNKQVNAEAASVFYGHNEFRFTSHDGRDILEAFCRTIGEANTRRLAKITHHITFDNRVDRNPCMSGRKSKMRSQILPVWLCKSNTSTRKISQVRWKDLPVWLKWRGMHMQGTTESPNFDFARALTENGGLREYKLVLPHEWHIRREHIARHLRCVFDHVVNPHGAASGIKITLVLLDPNFRAVDRLISMADLALWVEYKLHCDSVKLALQRGWEVIMATSVDKATGNYKYSAPLHSVGEYIRKVNYEAARVPHKDT
jgi:hypothetical protein